MAASQKVHVISTKYFMYINTCKIWKFVQLILWPGGITDATHATKAKITIPYSHEIMNHDYIGSFGNAKWAKKGKMTCYVLLCIVIFWCEVAYICN